MKWTGKERRQEKRERLESSDYTTKTMEDLEYLQEDLQQRTCRNYWEVSAKEETQESKFIKSSR